MPFNSLNFRSQSLERSDPASCSDATITDTIARPSSGKNSLRPVTSLHPNMGLKLHTRIDAYYGPLITGAVMECRNGAHVNGKLPSEEVSYRSADSASLSVALQL